jgi:enoyl-CoA hydratase/carnithine racemase
VTGWRTMLAYGRLRLPSVRTRSHSAFVASMSAVPSPAPSSGPPPSGPPVQACLAVSRQGILTLDASQKAPILEQPPAAASRLRTLVLNRPSALNALDKDMVDTLTARISALDEAPTVDAIVLSAVPGRAFCAGGDVRSLYDAGAGGDPAPLADYFRAEYSLNHMLGSLRSTTLISVLDGIVMGGGVGLSLHGRFRVATEATVWAMPENAIGLFPDCASSLFLAKLPGGLGTYLSLTGARLKGTDSSLLDSGIATHVVPSQNIPPLLERLGAVNLSSAGAISRAIAEFAPSEPLPPLAHRDIIDECFGGVGGSGAPVTAEVIVERLRAASKRDADGAKFAEATLQTLLKCCPTSVKVSLEAMKRSKRLACLADALKMDFRLGVRMSRRPDFYAGVRSAIVTKDKSPAWTPAGLADVADADVQAMFEPLSVDVGIPELDLSDQRARL